VVFLGASAPFFIQAGHALNPYSVHARLLPLADGLSTKRAPDIGGSFWFQLDLANSDLITQTVQLAQGATSLAGFAAGLLVMYLTAFLVNV
jgi:hypothetical protein